MVETSVVNALRVCPTEKAKLTVLGYLPSASCSSLSAKGMVIFGVLLFLCGFCWVFVWDFFVGFFGGWDLFALLDFGLGDRLCV